MNLIILQINLANYVIRLYYFSPVCPNRFYWIIEYFSKRCLISLYVAGVYNNCQLCDCSSAVRRIIQGIKYTIYTGI